MYLPPPGQAEPKPERPMNDIMNDVKATVKGITGEDIGKLTEILELLGLKNEGTLKQKVHAAATELDISIFVEVCDGWLRP